MRLLQTRSGFVFYTLDRQSRLLYFVLLCLFPNILKILAKCTHAAPRDLKTLFQTLFERIALKIAKGKNGFMEFNHNSAANPSEASN